MTSYYRRLSALAASAALVALSATPSEAGLFKPSKAAQTSVRSAAVLADFDQAMQEQRLVDAGRILDEALFAAPTDPQLMLRSGELHLARGRYDDAVRSFTAAEALAAVQAQARQGRGIALSQLGRSDEATAVLRQAVSADPGLWRAWNVLGVECDRRRDWTGAEAAYGKAIESPKAQPIVYNNRGYSRLLQGRYTDASADFVTALEKDPGLKPARMNLRLALALQGDYAKATASSDKDQKAGALNNAGFAAIMRGDLDEAERLFQQAIDTRGSTYGRAYQNLELVRALKSNAAEPGPLKP